MLIQRIEGVRTREKLRDYVLKHGCSSYEENLRIFDNWFAQGPRYLFRAMEKYGITQKPRCGVGCAYGMNLVYSAPESYGIEVEEYEVQFARSLGLTVYQRDMLSDNLHDLPKAEVVWCSAVLEPVDSPHIFFCESFTSC